MGVKRRRPLISFENILSQSTVVTPEILEPTRPSPPVGNLSVVKGIGGRRSQKWPAESAAICWDWGKQEEAEETVVEQLVQ